MSSALALAPAGSSRAAVRRLWSYRYLVGQLAWRETVARYRGTLLGLVWSILEPLLLFGFYLFVFAVVFEVRWGPLEESRTSYALNLFTGLVLYNLFAETVATAPGLILAHRSYVKRAIFPLEVLPLARLLSNLIHGGIGLLILLGASFAILGAVPWTVLLLPLVLLPLVLLTLGVSYFVASLGVFLRDVGSIVRLAVLGLLFLSPIFYPLSRLPPSWRRVLELNPLAPLIQDLRRICLRGELPEWGALAVVWMLSLVVAALGFAWFMRSKRAFADVL